MLYQTACVAGLGYVTNVAARWYLNRPISEILSGDQRRWKHPIEKPIGPGAEAVLASKDLTVRRQMLSLKDGTQIFYQTIQRKSVAPTHVLVYLHGYTSQSDLYLEPMSRFAREGALVLMFDLPCHGRSDGLLTFVPDWWAFIDQIWEVIDLLVPSLRGSSKPLPVFAAGMSLGGGITACLAVQRPTFFNGVVLIAPMLCVADDIKPPWIVQQIFKIILAPLLPTWPITPTKSMDGFDFRVVEQGERYVRTNPLSMQGLKSRLGTAMSFGFIFPDWMETKLKEVKTPLLILHGTGDKVTDPEVSKRLYNEAAAKDKSIKLLEGAYHCELFCCLPGNSKLIGMDWLPEQIQVTETAIEEIRTWTAKRA